MRRICSGVIVIFAAMTAGSSFGASADGALPDFNVEVNEPPQIVFMGDSIITGYGLEGYEAGDNTRCESFANILAKRYGEKLPAQADFKMYNEGLDGRTSEQLLEKIQSGDLDKELAEADAVVVSIGGNDLLYTIFSIIKDGGGIKKIVSRATDLSKDLDKVLDGFDERMSAIAEEIDKRTDGEIIVQTLYNPLESTSFDMLNKMSEKKINRLNEVIVECSQGGSVYTDCDVASGFKGRAEELTAIKDYDIHPNAEGHKLIAELLDETITSKTYTYYDAEAAKKYEAELAQAKLQKAEEEKEAAEKKVRTVTICAGTTVLAAVAAMTAVIVHRKKK